MNWEFHLKLMPFIRTLMQILEMLRSETEGQVPIIPAF